MQRYGLFLNWQNNSPIFFKKKEKKDKKTGWLSYSNNVDRNKQLEDILENGDKPFPIGTDIETEVRKMLMEEFPQELLNSNTFELVVQRTVQRLKEQQMKREDGIND